MPWPEKVIRQFQTIPPNPIESDFHGAYNKLLCTLFSPDTDFTVVLGYPKPASSKSSDFIVTFEFFFENKPVFILELKKPADLCFISSRRAADVHIRERLGDLADECPIPTLHAVSAMGTRLCFYHLDTIDVAADIIPLGIPRHPTRVNDTAPMERWDCDVLDAEGEARLRAVVDSIKTACENIANA
ncbi:hypothetical protein BJV78DRAFT_1117960 [Lactifluus subvellereus]|nr:hypothetical protein BJV78DRAFT_1117960 [Lactifluus subvellereus]